MVSKDDKQLEQVTSKLIKTVKINQENSDKLKLRTLGTPLEINLM